MRTIQMQKVHNLFHPDELDNFLKQIKLKVNGFGHRKEKYIKDRTDLRVMIDFQIIYITDGKLVITIDDEDIVGIKGDVIVIPPFVARIINGAEDMDGEYTWVHFDINAIYMYELFLKVIMKDNSYILSEYSSVIDECFNKIKYNISSHNIGNISLVTLLLNEIIIYIIRNKNEKISYNASPITNDIIKRSTDYIEQNLNENINIQDIATFLNISPSYVYKIFSKEVHMSPNKYIQLLRAKSAFILINTTTYSLKEICDHLGFRNYSYFNKFFIKWYKYSPSYYRK